MGGSVTAGVGGAAGRAGRAVTVTSRERILWPAAGFTKGQLIDYLLAVAPVLLPRLAGRPVTLRRFPEGVDGPGWYQTECRGAPDWLPSVVVRGARGAGQRYCVIEEPAALVWAANRGAVEIIPCRHGPTPLASRPRWCSISIQVRPRRSSTHVGSPSRPVASSLPKGFGPS